MKTYQVTHTQTGKKTKKLKTHLINTNTNKTLKHVTSKFNTAVKKLNN